MESGFALEGCRVCRPTFTSGCPWTGITARLLLRPGPNTIFIRGATSHLTQSTSWVHKSCVPAPPLAQTCAQMHNLSFGLPPPRLAPATSHQTLSLTCCADQRVAAIIPGCLVREPAEVGVQLARGIGVFPVTAYVIARGLITHGRGSAPVPAVSLRRDSVVRYSGRARLVDALLTANPGGVVAGKRGAEGHIRGGGEGRGGGEKHEEREEQLHHVVCVCRWFWLWGGRRGRGDGEDREDMRTGRVRGEMGGVASRIAPLDCLESPGLTWGLASGCVGAVLIVACVVPWRFPISEHDCERSRKIVTRLDSPCRATAGEGREPLATRSSCLLRHTAWGRGRYCAWWAPGECLGGRGGRGGDASDAANLVALPHSARAAPEALHVPEYEQPKVAAIQMRCGAHGVKTEQHDARVRSGRTVRRVAEQGGR